eukprot:368218_1
MATLRLQDKICIITGAARKGGIGRGIAKIFAKQGAKLFLLDIAQFEAIDKSLQASIISVMKCDVSSSKSIKQTMDDIAHKLGSGKQIDVVVNNAAIFTSKSVIDATDDDWTDIMSVNIKGYALVMKHSIPMMRKGGSIVNIASVSGVRCVILNQCTYGTTKAAIIQLTKNTAYDIWGKYRIRVNAVCPGVVSTSLMEEYCEMKINNGEVKSRSEWLDSLSNFCIIKDRICSVEDVAYAVLFFASDESKYCTGTHLMVDGGWCAL